MVQVVLQEQHQGLQVLAEHQVHQELVALVVVVELQVLQEQAVQVRYFR